MKKQLLILFVAVATLVGCGKDGETGPQGIKGEKGDKGDQGVAGVDGTVIHSGNGAPSSSLGKTGDYYIDLSTGNLYGAKTTSWGNPMSLKGEKGNDGDNGSNGRNGATIRSGNGAPSIFLGEVGDFYFDKESLAFYGPKTPSSWGDPTILGGTQNGGVQIFLAKNVKFLKPISNGGGDEYPSTRPFFFYTSEEINMGSVNMKKGIYFMYWRYNNPNTDNNVTVNNYFNYSWSDLVVNGTDYGFTHSNQIVNLRLDPSRNGYNPIKGIYVFQPLLVGTMRNTNGQPSDPNTFNEFHQNASFDILIKYIPEASVTQIQKSGQDINKLLSVQIN